MEHISKIFQGNLPYIWLIATLVTPTLLGPFSAYLWIFFSITLAVALILKQSIINDALGLFFLSLFLAIGTTYIFSANGIYDLTFLINFIALALYSTSYTHLIKIAKPKASLIFARLAFLGCAMGATIACVENIAFDANRAGYLFSDPIRLAHTTLLLSGFALLGARIDLAKYRWIYLLAPLMAWLTIYLAGARTALVASMPIFLLASLLLPVGRWKLAGAATVIAIFVGALFAFWADLMPGRLQSIGITIAQFLTGSEIADRSFAIRADLYRASILAFQDALWTGHGGGNFMASLEPYLSDAFKDQISLPHAHNDLLNFALTSGILGIFIYFGLITAPLIAAFRSPRDSQYSSRLYLMFILVGGYVVMGQTDTMLAYETHTTLYIAYCAAIIAFCRDTTLSPVKLAGATARP